MTTWPKHEPDTKWYLTYRDAWAAREAEARWLLEKMDDVFSPDAAKEWAARRRKWLLREEDTPIHRLPNGALKLDDATWVDLSIALQHANAENLALEENYTKALARTEALELALQNAYLEAERESRLLATTQQQLDFHVDVVKQYQREAEKLKDTLEAAEQTIEETAFILAYRPGDISHGRAFDLALARLRRDNPNAGRVAISARKENSP